MLPPAPNNSSTNKGKSVLNSFYHLANWCAGANKHSFDVIVEFPLDKKRTATLLSFETKKSSLILVLSPKANSTRLLIRVNHLLLFNPWNPRIQGHLEEHPDGCILRARINISPTTKFLFYTWLFVAICIISIGCLVAHNHTIGYYCLFPVFGILVARLGNFFGKSDEDKLLLFIDDLEQTIKQVLND